MIKVINESEFQKEVIESEEIVLVDFFATWCPPCQMLAPVLEKISESRLGQKIIKVNIDENTNLAIKYGVEVVPTMVIFKNGKEESKIIGFVEENEIVEKLSKYL